MMSDPTRAGKLSGHLSCDLGLLVGAGEGNRTLMTSLEGWGSAIELRPHRPSQQRGASLRRPGQSRVAYRLPGPGTPLEVTAMMCRDGVPEATPELTSGNTTRVTVLPTCRVTEAS
jgi:hypothetical protein